MSQDTSNTIQRVVLAQADNIDCSFTRTGSGLIAEEAVQMGSVGNGMTVAQAYGNLLVDTGTTANSEFLFRSSDSVSGAHIARAKIQLSQTRIANQITMVMLADLIGENVPYVADATGLLISVTLRPGHGFTSANVGQSMFLGGNSNTSVTVVPGRYAIQSVTGNVIVFSPVVDCTWTRAAAVATLTFLGGNPTYSINETATVSASSDTNAIVNGVVTLLTQSFSNGSTATFACLNAGATSGTLTLTMTQKAATANATGTLTVYGWNNVHLCKNGTSATTAFIDTQRRGWATGQQSITTNTDLLPGHIVQFYGDTILESFSDATPASQTTALQFTSRGTRVENLPSQSIQFYTFVSVYNGVTAPATTTRVTVGLYRMLDIGVNKVQISGYDQTGYGSQSDVRVLSAPTTTVTGTVIVAGAAAHSAATSGNPNYVAGKVVPTTAATVDTTLVAGDTGGIPVSTGNQAVVKHYGTSELDWAAVVSFTPTAWASATTPTTIRPASGTASVRTYMTGMRLQTDALGAATTLFIIDGAVAVTSVTIATPGVFTNSGTNDFKVGDAVVFGSLGTITGISVNTIYYVTATSLAATTFTLAATVGGTALQITGATAAVTAYRVLTAARLQTTALPITDIDFVNPIRTNSNVALAALASGTTTGTIYIQPNGYYGF